MLIMSCTKKNMALILHAQTQTQTHSGMHAERNAICMYHTHTHTRIVGFYFPCVISAFFKLSVLVLCSFNTGTRYKYIVITANVKYIRIWIQHAQGYRYVHMKHDVQICMYTCLYLQMHASYVAVTWNCDKT